MAEPRKRRTVRRAAIALAVVVLLMSGYFSSYFGVWWLAQNGLISLPVFDAALVTVYQPITWYTGTFRPGSEYVIRWRSEITRQAQMRSAKRAAAEDEAP